MANEFVARKGLIISGSTRASGSITAFSFTGSVFGTASSAISSSYVPNLYITASDAAPTSPDINELWYDSTTGKTYIYYRSASVLQWVLQADPTYDPGPSIQDLQDVTDVGSSTTNAITITNTTTAVDSSSGALIVSGGVGIKGALYANTINSNTVTATSFVGSLTGSATTASYVTFANVANKPALISSSTQFNSLTAPFTGSFTGSLTGNLTGTSSFATFAASATTTNALTLGAGLTGGTFNGSAAVTTTVDTSSAHFTNGVKSKLNADGVISSSTQFTSLTAPFTGSFTGSHFGTLVGTSSYATNAGVANTVTTNTVSYTAGAGLSGGGTATLGGSSVTIDVVAGAGISLTGPTNDAVNIDTASAHFTGGVKSKLNTDGVISSSTQFTSLTAPFTGSFTGSFKGDGSALTGVTATSVDYANVTNKPALVSSSTQFNSLTAPFTGSFTGSFRGNLTGTGSWANTASVAVSSSYALTASYALNGGTGTGGNSFVTFSIAGQNDVIADSANDTMTLVAGSGITLTTNASTDSITIAATAADPQAFNIDTYEFIGDGTTVNYNIVNSYNINSLAVSVDGLTYMPSDDYTVSTNTLTFITSPPSQSNILVRAFVNATTGVTGSFTGSFFGIISTSSFATTASFAVSASWAPGGAGTVTSVAAGSGLSGGTITNAGTISLDTSSAHFLDGVKKELNTEGVISSSTQFNSLTAPFTGSFTGSFRGNLTGTGSWANTASVATTVTTNTVSYTAGAGLSGGGSATLGGSSVTIDAVAGSGISLTAPTNDAINIDTGSAHFTGGVKSRLNTEGVISSSTQFASLTAPFTGSFTGSFRGALTGTGSWANTASVAISSSYALSASYAPGGSGTVTQIIAGAGLTGGTITDTGTITIDTSSVHFLDGVKKELNTEGVISSSTQFTSLTAPFTGSFTGSFKGNLTGTGSWANTASVAITSSFVLPSGLPSGVVSSSTQFSSLTAPFTGSFTGSFNGNFSGSLDRFNPTSLRITVGTTTPTSPSVNDLWVDTN